MASLFGNATEDHIPRQNAAGEDLAEVLNQYHSGLISPSQAVAGIDRVADDFEEYVNSIGSARALQGGRDIRSLSDRIISDIMAEVGVSQGSSTAGIDFSGETGSAWEQTQSAGGVILPRYDPITGRDTMPIAAQGSNAQAGPSPVVIALVALAVIYALSKL